MALIFGKEGLISFDYGYQDMSQAELRPTSDPSFTSENQFIANELGPETPWHVTAFHPDYQMLDASPTSVETLQRAKKIGQDAGLQYIYVGNVPVEHSTYCPKCGERLIERWGFGSGNFHLDEDGKCQFCGEQIPGIWK